MSLTSYYRIIRLGLMNFWRNRWLSLAAILMMTLTLLIISFFAILNLSISSMVDTIQSRINLEVFFFKDEIPNSDINALTQDLKKQPEVIDVHFVSKEEARENWYKYEIDPSVLNQITKEFNPLPRSLQIKTQRPEQINSMVTFLKQAKYQNLVCQETRCMSYNRESNRRMTEKLIKTTHFTQQAGIAVGGLFVLVSILIILNTIRLTIFTRRDEIEIMKLVGASHGFIRIPFVIESLLYGVFATLLSLAIIAPVVKYISPFVSRTLGYYNLNLVQFFKENLWYIIILQLAVSLFIAFICSILSIRKYLKS